MTFRVSWGGLQGAWEQVPPPRLGHPASKAFQSQPHLSSHQKGFSNGQNLTFWVGKKENDNKNQTSHPQPVLIFQRRNNFIAKKRINFSQHGMVSYGKRL